jgi:pyruvate dehydrogenase E2 component (dihydrolipoamide acetyltransferase)
MSEFHLPSLGADMDEATIIEWHVKPGDTIKRGAILVAVETSKGIIDIEFFDDAVIDGICVPVGEKVSVGTVLAVYHGSNDTVSVPAVVKPEIKPTEKPVGKPSGKSAFSAVVKPVDASRLHISPAARRRARELHVDVEKVQGSGPHGAITIEDVEQLAKLPTVPVVVKAVTSGMRETIAAAMVRSKREIPHYYLASTIDMTAALDWLEQQNKTRAVTGRLVYSVLLIKAVALALKKSPELNGWWRDETFKAAECFNIGMAISLRQGGLVVPALQDVDKKPVSTLMPEFLDVVTRARSGHLRSSDLVEASITITNLGEQGAETVFPVIYPPQVAIVGFGSLVERPWSVNGVISSRHLIHASLAADHRASDGQRGSRFLSTLGQLLQQPEKL